MNLSAIISGVVLLISYSAYAAPCTKSRPNTVGGECTSTKGVRFRLIAGDSASGEYWLDLKAKKIWSPVLATRVDKTRAQEACAQLRFQTYVFGLPSADEFSQLDKNGGRDVLSKMKDYFFWTSTTHPNSANVRRVYSGSSGSQFWVMYNNITYDSVRCVAIVK